MKQCQGSGYCCTVSRCSEGRKRHGLNYGTPCPELVPQGDILRCALVLEDFERWSKVLSIGIRCSMPSHPLRDTGQTATDNTPLPPFKCEHTDAESYRFIQGGLFRQCLECSPVRADRTGLYTSPQKQS